MPTPGNPVPMTLAADAGSTGPAAGGAVAIPVIAVIITVIVILCRPTRGRKITTGTQVTTAALGGVAGILLSGTTFGSALASGTVELITNTLGALTGLFTG
ncbi:hypothetical protein LWC34_06545 [Kibdelosporangium philippinense]|uniref:Uncharacterized protein n=1 Tax=Kibdelosporangium philippinense TaxID=211113 RepID=A0ABS8Z3U4_9PSEU|nr:hypothetical protein [Kibdelosporangium philippinense]MCE7002490.1 hypothetical protein [Kibdelosporangium philippinense]